MANKKRSASLSEVLEDFLDAVSAHLSGGISAPRGAGKVAGKGAAKGRRKGTGRKLDMSCRVAGCKELSRGPRFGFICDAHGKELSKKEQEAAREAWKAKHKK